MGVADENKELFGSLVALIRSASSLYSLDVGFVRSLNAELARRSEDASSRVLKLINELAGKSSPSLGETRENYTDADSVTRRWRSIEQTLDLLMDKIDAPPRKSKAIDEDNSQKSFMRKSNAIEKPQLQFNTKVDNSVGPFRPLLTKKPFATYTPLDQALKMQQPDDLHEAEWYEQPYKEEIMRAEYPVTNPEEDVKRRPDWDSTPFTFVDTPSKMFKMISKLEKASIIAVDVEHHEYRSYLGLVCLVQITGLGEDYVVDTLALRSELQSLNKVFANPAIVKVLHGAKMDILWLQRDLGVYIVSLFDTYYASVELGLPKHSLAYLLQQFADFQAQKKYQLADWRIRPLPQELMDYARGDTHFLLYVYFQLRAKLMEVNKFETVLSFSKDVAARRYEKPGWNEDEPGWVHFAINYRLHGRIQRAALVKLFEWRDMTAREYDESPRYVMGHQYLANLCVTRPETAEGVLSASHHVSPIVREHAKKISEIITEVNNDPDAVDMSTPEKKVRQHLLETPVNTPVDELKLADSSLFGYNSVRNGALDRPPIFLGVIESKDLHRAQAMVEPASVDDGSMSDSDDNSDVLEDGEEEEDQDIESSEAAPNSTKSALSLKGKRINVVEDTESFDVDRKIASATSRERKDVKDEPAFNFQEVKPVMNLRQKDDEMKSFSQFGRAGTGPKGVSKSNAKFKRAKSFR